MAEFFGEFGSKTGVSVRYKLFGNAVMRKNVLAV
jgi:hypothetical protein